MERICDDLDSAMMFINIYCKILGTYPPNRAINLSASKGSLSYLMVFYLCFQAYIVYRVGRTIYFHLLALFNNPVHTYMSKNFGFYNTTYYELLALTAEILLKYIEICIAIIFFYVQRRKIYITFFKLNQIDQQLKILGMSPRYDKILLFSVFLIIALLFVVILHNRILIVYPISYINEIFYFDMATDSPIAYLIILLCCLRQKFVQLNNYIANTNYDSSHKSLKDIINIHYKILFCCEYINYVFKVPIAFKLVNMCISIMLQTFYLAYTSEETLLLNLVVYPKFVFSFIVVINFAQNLENQVRIYVHVTNVHTYFQINFFGINNCK